MLWTPPHMGRVIAPSYSLRGVVPGVHNLLYPTPAIALDGVTVSPAACYLGKDAGATWAPFGGYGETILLKAGNPSYNQATPWPGANDLAVLCDGTAWWEGSASLLAWGTCDFVIHYIGQWARSSIIYQFLDRDPAGANVGVGFSHSTTNPGKLRLFMDIGASVLYAYSDAITSETWFDAWLFADRSGSAQWYVNGEASGSASDISSGSAISLTNAGTFCLASGAAGGGAFTLPFTLIAIYIRASWLSTHLQAAFAREQYAKLMAIYPNTAWGGATPEVI